MTVDSEAIFAVAAHSNSDPRALEALHGSMAAAWLDEREPQLVRVARGVGRPLWLGEGRDGAFFASTKVALEVLENYCGLSLRKRQLREGTLLSTAGREDRRSVTLQPPAVRRDRSAARCARSRGARVLPDAPRRSHSCLSHTPVGTDAGALFEQPAAHEELERRPCAAA